MHPQICSRIMDSDCRTISVHVFWMVRDCQTICFFKKNSKPRKVVVFFVVVRFTGDLESGEEKGGFLSSENGEWLKLVDMLWLLAFVVPPNHAGPCGFMDPSVFTGHSFLLCPSPFTFLSVCVCVCEYDLPEKLLCATLNYSAISYFCGHWRLAYKDCVTVFYILKLLVCLQVSNLWPNVTALWHPP